MFVASRLASRIIIELGSVMPKLNVPFPVTYEVTSTEVHAFELTAPEAFTYVPRAGELV